MTSQEADGDGGPSLDVTPESAEACANLSLLPHRQVMTVDRVEVASMTAATPAAGTDGVAIASMTAATPAAGTDGVGIQQVLMAWPSLLTAATPAAGTADKLSARPGETKSMIQRSKSSPLSDAVTLSSPLSDEIHDPEIHYLSLDQEPTHHPLDHLGPEEAMGVEFTIPGAPAGHCGIKKAIFLPNGMAGKPETAELICKFFKISKPQLLLEVGCGIWPLKDCLTEKIVQASEDFDELREVMKDVDKHRRISKIVQASEDFDVDSVDVKFGNQSSFEVVTEYFRKKLQSVMENVSTALKNADSGFFVGPEKPFIGTTHFLLESSMTSSDLTPTIFAIQDPFVPDDPRQKALGWYTGVSAQLLLHAKHIVNPSNRVELCVNWDNLTLDPLVDGKGEWKTRAGEATKDRELENSVLDFLNSHGVKSRFEVAHWCWRSATHFIFAKDIKDLNINYLSRSPPGYLSCFGTDPIHMQRCITSAQQCAPFIVTKFTPEAAHQIASILEKLRRPKELQTVKSRAEFWSEISSQASTSEHSGDLVTLSDVLTLCDIYQANRELLKDILVPVDAMKEKPEAVLEKLSMAFNVAAMASTEVGAGQADLSVVLRMWQIFSTIQPNGEKQGFLSIYVLIATLVLAFLATSSGVLVAYVENADGGAPPGIGQSSWVLLQHSTVVFAAANSFLVAVMSHGKHGTKASCLKLKGAQLVQECYRFRLRVYPYDQHISPPKTASGDEIATDLGAEVHTGLSKQARSAFAIAVQKIASETFSGEMSEDAHHECHFGENASDPMVQSRIHRALYGPKTRLQCPRRFNRLKGLKGYLSTLRPSAALAPKEMPNDLPEKSPEGKQGEKVRRSSMLSQPLLTAVVEHIPEVQVNVPDHDFVEPPVVEPPVVEPPVVEPTAYDDFVGPLTVEAYLQHRLEPLLRKYKIDAQRVQRIDYGLNMLCFTATLSSTILAAFAGSRTLVPITVAVGSSLHTFIAHSNFKKELSGLNMTISTLMGCLTFWDSLSIVDRRLVSTRERIVREVETAVMTVVTDVSVIQAQDSGEKPAANAEKKKKKKKKQK